MLKARITGGIILLIFLLAVLLTGNTFTYLNFDPTFGFLKLKQEAIKTGWYLPAYYAHIFAGGVVLLTGFFQFNSSIRLRFRKLHRMLGYGYVCGILFLAAPGGLIMAIFIDRGPVVFASFVLQCGLWFWFTTEAFRQAKRKNFIAHEQWMTRSFALTLAAVTLRVYIFIASWNIDLGQPGAYALFAWLSWLPNLGLAEVIIQKKLHRISPAVPAKTEN